MAIVKLDAGQKLLFEVTSVEEVAGKFGPQYKFTEKRGDIMFMNVDASLRQLGRIGLTAQTAVGQTLEFERVEKDGTKYTNINKPGTAKLAAAGKEAYSAGPHIPEIDGPLVETGAPPAGAVDRFGALVNLYNTCLDQAISASKKMDTANIGTTPEAVAAMAATIFIAAKDKGLAA